MDKDFGLTGKLLKMVIAYDELKIQNTDIEDTLKKINEEIKEFMKSKKIDKAKSQIYTVVLSHIKTKRLSEKKLKEELKARGLYDIYESCLYDSVYDQLRVTKRKGGANIF